jgi:aspartate/methionine/tyrosine aminotransferase
MQLAALVKKHDLLIADEVYREFMMETLSRDEYSWIGRKRNHD